MPCHCQPLSFQHGWSVLQESLFLSAGETSQLLAKTFLKHFAATMSFSFVRHQLRKLRNVFVPDGEGLSLGPRDLSLSALMSSPFERTQKGSKAKGTDIMARHEGGPLLFPDLCILHPRISTRQPQLVIALTFGHITFLNLRSSLSIHPHTHFRGHGCSAPQPAQS